MRRDPLACRKIAIFGISAGIAQLVERDLPKVDVEGPNPFSRLSWRTCAASRGVGHSNVPRFETGDRRAT